MFQKINSNLLLKHPLAWNTKILPFLFILILFNLIFFGLGYQDGALNFKRDNYNYQESVVIIFSILLSILVFISWALLYFKNNAFKSFYPKSGVSIFKEWLFILVICTLNLSYIPTYFFAQEKRARDYFTESEFISRCEIITQASIFLDGSYQEGYYITVEDGAGNWKQVRRDSFDFENRKYALESLINKGYTSFSILDDQKDSLNVIKVKKWMIANQQDSIKQVLNQFLKILDSHNLESNISGEEWFQKVYDFPEFTNYYKIGKRINAEDYYIEDYYDEEVIADTTAVQAVIESASSNIEYDPKSFDFKLKNGVKNYYYKYYVNSKHMEDAYDTISRAWTSPTIDFQYLTLFFHIVFGFSFLFFSFRFTSGRSWLISLLTTITLGILIGAVFSLRLEHSTRLSVMIGIILFFIVYFAVIVWKSRTKKISAVILNLGIWHFQFLPILVYYLIIEIMKLTQNYYKVSYDQRNATHFPEIEFLESFVGNFLGINLILSIIFMFILSKSIRKWKGIAES